MTMLYQHDGALPYSTNAVKNYLNEYITIPDRWIGLNGPILWPPRSPDLTPLDYFLWGYIKGSVYSTTVRNEEECHQRILRAFESVDEDMIRRATTNFRRRAELLLDQNGRHFEQLLWSGFWYRPFSGPKQIEKYEDRSSWFIGLQATSSMVLFRLIIWKIL